MTEIADNTHQAMCYPKKPVYNHWKEIAEERGYNSVSRFMIDMIEAGYKQIEISVDYDEDARELRKQRNDLRDQLDNARRRIETLENQLYQGERQVILDFLADQSEGATFAELVQHIIDDTPAIVASHVEAMVDEELTVADGQYVVTEGDDGEY